MCIVPLRGYVCPWNPITVPKLRSPCNEPFHHVRLIPPCNALECMISPARNAYPEFRATNLQAAPALTHASSIRLC